MIAALGPSTWIDERAHRSSTSTRPRGARGASGSASISCLPPTALGSSTMSTNSHEAPAASSSMLAPSSSFRISRKPTPAEHDHDHEDGIGIEDIDAEDENRAIHWGHRSGHGLEGKRSTTTSRSLGLVSDSPDVLALSSPQHVPQAPHIRTSYHDGPLSPMPHIPGALALSSADSSSESDAAADKFLSPLSVRVIQAWGSRHSQHDPTSPEATAEHEREDISVVYAPRICRLVPTPLLEPVASNIVPKANGTTAGAGNGGGGDSVGGTLRANTNLVPAPGGSSTGQALDNPVSKLSKLQRFVADWVFATVGMRADRRVFRAVTFRPEPGLLVFERGILNATFLSRTCC